MDDTQKYYQTNLSTPYVIPTNASLDVFMSPELKTYSINSTVKNIYDGNYWQWQDWVFGGSIFRSLTAGLIGLFYIDLVVPDTNSQQTTTGSSITLNPVNLVGYMPAEEFVFTPAYYSSASWISIVLGVLGTLGGVFVSINGAFVMIFGRTIWAVIAGMLRIDLPSTIYPFVPRD